MRQRLHHRLQQLEEVRAQARKLEEGREQKDPGANAREKFRLFLELRGVEQGLHESLAEELARALEISCRELDGLLAAGIDPIDKYLTEHGVYEEIETRKAAGTWPGG